MANKNKIEVILTAIDKGLTSGLNKARASINGMAAAVTGLVPALILAGTGAAGLTKLVTVAREFDKINAGLITATGSAANASLAFTAIQDFAADTPYDLQQVTDSFIKLVNYGLDPSERAMTSYGNTASALGRDLNQMIEAVADAATGEFERLKEFGIKAKSEGDKVSFTFRGITETVGKNAAEIEQYLIKLGETNFGDAMLNRMTTLDGALSNLGDEWDKVFVNISQAGVGDVIADTVRLGIDALANLNAAIASGQLEASLRAQIARWDGWASDIMFSIDLVGDYFATSNSMIADGGNWVVDTLIEAFRHFPENVRAFVGILTVDMAAGFDKIMALARSFQAQVKAVFNPGDTTTLGARISREYAIINDARESSIDAILAERDTSIKSTEAQREAAKKLRADYEATQEARKADLNDRLAGFKISAADTGGQPTGTGTASAANAKAAATKAEAAAKKAAAEYDKQLKAATKLADEKMRAASREKILALELDSLDASRLPTAVARAEAELAIARQVTEEKVSLKRQELAALRTLDGVDPAEIIRAESDLSAMRLEVSRTELEGQRTIASARLAAIDDSWRQSGASIAEYRRLVDEAYALGLIETEDYNEKMIASGNSLGDGLRQGFRNAMEGLRTDAEIMMQLGQEIPNRIASGLTSVFDGMMQSSADAKAAVIDWARSTISWIAQVILQQAILNGMQAMKIGMATGGQVPAQALASGGSVGGWSPSPTADNIPIWATAREFMQPVRAVDYYGVDFMERIRRLQFPRNIAHALAGGTVPRVPSGYRLAAGGQVPGQAPAANVKSGDTRLQVINVLDKNMVGDYLRTADGETAIINMIRRNGSAIRTIIGR